MRQAHERTKALTSITPGFSDSIELIALGIQQHRLAIDYPAPCRRSCKMRCQKLQTFGSPEPVIRAEEADPLASRVIQGSVPRGIDSRVSDRVVPGDLPCACEAFDDPQRAVRRSAVCNQKLPSAEGLP